MTGRPGSRESTVGEPSAATVESLVRRIQGQDPVSRGRTATRSSAADVRPLPSASAPDPDAPTGAHRTAERARAGRGATDRGRIDRNHDRGPWLGLLGRAEWERIVRHEALRQQRYGHVHAVVLAEIRGLDPDVPPPALVDIERSMPACGAALLQVSRASDRIARVGPARFGILLRESDATGAGRYAARVLAACDPWLAANPLPMRLAIGWSAPDGDGDLGRAPYLADRHLTTGRRG